MLALSDLTGRIDGVRQEDKDGPRRCGVDFTADVTAPSCGATV